MDITHDATEQIPQPKRWDSLLSKPISAECQRINTHKRTTAPKFTPIAPPHTPMNRCSTPHHHRDRPTNHEPMHCNLSKFDNSHHNNDATTNHSNDAHNATSNCQKLTNAPTKTMPKTAFSCAHGVPKPHPPTKPITQLILIILIILNYLYIYTNTNT